MAEKFEKVKKVIVNGPGLLDLSYGLFKENQRLIFTLKDGSSNIEGEARVNLLTASALGPEKTCWKLEGTISEIHWNDGSKTFFAGYLSSFSARYLLNTPKGKKGHLTYVLNQ